MMTVNMKLLDKKNNKIGNERLIQKEVTPLEVVPGELDKKERIIQKLSQKFKKIIPENRKQISSCYIKYTVKGTTVPMYALVDTGCEMSMISVNELRNFDIEDLNIMKTHQKLDTFGQARFLITKCVELTIALENNDNEHKIVFLIDEREESSGTVIGQDELRTMGCDIDLGVWNKDKCQVISRDKNHDGEFLMADLYYMVDRDRLHQIMFAKNFKSKKHFSSPYVMLDISGDQIKTFVDLGASDSVIPMKILRQMGKLDEIMESEITGLQGLISEIESLGKVQLKILLKDQEYGIKVEFYHTFEVMGGDVEDVTIGLPFFTLNNLVHSSSMNCISTVDRLKLNSYFYPRDQHVNGELKIQRLYPSTSNGTAEAQEPEVMKIITSEDLPQNDVTIKFNESENSLLGRMTLQEKEDRNALPNEVDFQMSEECDSVKNKAEKSLNKDVVIHVNEEKGPVDTYSCQNSLSKDATKEKKTSENDGPEESVPREIIFHQSIALMKNSSQDVMNPERLPEILSQSDDEQRKGHWNRISSDQKFNTFTQNNDIPSGAALAQRTPTPRRRKARIGVNQGNVVEYVPDLLSECDDSNELEVRKVRFTLPGKGESNELEIKKQITEMSLAKHEEGVTEIPMTEPGESTRLPGDCETEETPSINVFSKEARAMLKDYDVKNREAFLKFTEPRIMEEKIQSKDETDQMIMRSNDESIINDEDRKEGREEMAWIINQLTDKEIENRISELRLEYKWLKDISIPQETEQRIELTMLEMCLAYGSDKEAFLEDQAALKRKPPEVADEVTDMMEKKNTMLKVTELQDAQMIQRENADKHKLDEETITKLPRIQNIRADQDPIPVIDLTDNEPIPVDRSEKLSTINTPVSVNQQDVTSEQGNPVNTGIALHNIAPMSMEHQSKADLIETNIGQTTMSELKDQGVEVQRVLRRGERARKSPDRY